MADPLDSRILAPSVGKKMGLKLESSKNEAGERTYRMS